jgi:hypothetical protein
MLVTQQDLPILTDAAGVVLMLKESIDYRRFVTERLQLEMSMQNDIRPEVYKGNVPL